MPNIIQLDDHRPGPTGPNGIIFPQVYRLRGDYWKLTPDEKHVVPYTGPKKPLPVYSLSDTDHGGYANPTWEPIKCFDSTVDAGWLMVRHHPTEREAQVHADALADQIGGFHLDTRTAHTVFQSKEGFFTLSYREAVPDAPDDLIIFVAQTPDTIGFGGLPLNKYLIFHPDGSTSADEDKLFYPHGSH